MLWPKPLHTARVPNMIHLSGREKPSLLQQRQTEILSQMKSLNCVAYTNLTAQWHAPSLCPFPAVSAVSSFYSLNVWASRASPRPAGPAEWTSPSASQSTGSACSVSWWVKSTNIGHISSTSEGTEYHSVWIRKMSFNLASSFQFSTQASRHCCHKCSQQMGIFHHQHAALTKATKRRRQTHNLKEESSAWVIVDHLD